MPPPVIRDLRDAQPANWRARCSHPRSGRLAFDTQIVDTAKHQPPVPAAPLARTQPGREHLAVHARQLAVKPRLQELRRYRRTLLPSVKRTRQPAMEDHVNRHARLGARVLINADWH